MIDDERQLPMFSSDDPREALLFDVIKAQAETLRVIAAVNHELVELEKRRSATKGNGTVGSLRGTTIGALRDNSAQKTRPHGPRDRELREWPSFRRIFQQHERVYRRDHQMGPDDRLTKEMLSSVVGYVVKSITRLTRAHGLEDDQWPPSTWPEAAPGDKF